MQNESKNNEGISLYALLDGLRKRAVIIIAITVACGAIVFACSKYCLTPQYESMASLYILTKETTLTSLADLQIGAQLASDYEIIITSRPVLQDVVDRLNLNYNYKQLKERLVIDNPKNTRILTISIQDPNPEMAKIIVDTVAATASDYISDTMEMIPPKIIETGDIASEKSAPNNAKNAIIAALIGFIITCLFFSVRIITDDVISTPEDIEKYIDIPVLAAVPVRSDTRKEMKKKNEISGKKKR